MPDWSFRTFLRPLLLCLPSERARRFAVGTLGVIGRSAVGRAAIDFLGHMGADARLSTTFAGRTFPGPVGIGAMLDPSGAAIGAFGRFGCGFIEIGPVAERSGGCPDWNVDIPAGVVSHRGPEPSVSVNDAVAHLSARPDHLPQVFVRLSPAPDEILAGLAARFGELACGIVLPRCDAALIRSVREVFPGIVLVATPAGISDFTAFREADGVWISGDAAATRRSVGAAREALDEKMIIAGGVLEPADVRELLAAGASLVSVDAGLVLSGPGFLKRTNEALLSGLPRMPLERLSLDAARWSWFWTLMLGIAMALGGAMAAIIACTRVVLPYDEALCGISRGAFAAINPRLLPFMAHDRMCVAGTMICIGVLYSAIAWNAARRGAHWAKVAIVWSAMSGFFSFFLFLGFGYFDPFHAFVTAVVFQFVVLTLFAPLGPAHPPAVAQWRETAAWRRGQWGQLLFVCIGIALVGAGAVISVVGCTSVLVGTDVDFLQTTAARLMVANDRLMSLIAHDRASLGGMLISNGIVIWLAAQWGIRAGERWLWLALAVAGNVAFGAAVGVHLAVGYQSWPHLVPAIAGWFVWLLALVLTRQWMCGGEADANHRRDSASGTWL